MKVVLMTPETYYTIQHIQLPCELVRLLNYCQKYKQSHLGRVCYYDKKVNAARRLASMSLHDRITSYTKTRKIEVRYDPEQLSIPPRD